MATPAVSGKAPYFICTDETSCDWEKVTLCAFDGAGSQIGGELTANASAFLLCMDSHDHLPLFYEPSIAKGCAEQAGLPWQPITRCFDGSHGDTLLSLAATRVTQQFGKQGFGLPTVVVDGQPVCSQDACDYDTVAKALGED